MTQFQRALGQVTSYRHYVTSMDLEGLCIRSIRLFGVYDRIVEIRFPQDPSKIVDITSRFLPFGESRLQDQEIFLPVVIRLRSKDKEFDVPLMLCLPTRKMEHPISIMTLYCGLDGKRGVSLEEVSVVHVVPDHTRV